MDIVRVSALAMVGASSVMFAFVFFGHGGEGGKMSGCGQFQTRQITINASNASSRKKKHTPAPAEQHPACEFTRMIN